MGYTQGDNGQRIMVYVTNTRKVLAVQDVIIKVSEVGSFLDNTETPDLLEVGSQQLGIWAKLMIIKTMTAKRHRAHLQ